MAPLGNGLGNVVRILAVLERYECLVLVEGEEVSEWISVHDDLPEETQAYGCTTDVVNVRNANSGFEGMAYLARTTTGERWFTDVGGFELHSVTHWRYQ